jgi:hypothetical protein
MKTPDYILIAEYNYVNDNLDHLILPAGAFVRPIEECYVPKHVKDRKINAWFNGALEVYCYTRQGIIAIPWDQLRLK